MEDNRERGELKAEICRPDDDQPQVKLFADFAKDWMRDRIREDRWAESTTNKNHRILKHHIVPVLGNLYVDEIDRAAIRRWINYANDARRMIKGESVPYLHHTLRSWWGRVKELVNALYLAGHCDRLFLDWCKDRRGPSSNVTDRKESRTLTRDELITYVAKAKELAPPRYAEIVTLAYTGMRAGELFGLEWRHIDYDAGVIFVEQSITRTGKIKGTKTGSKRTAPLIPAIGEAIQEHRERLLREQNSGLKHGIVFPADHGERRLTPSLRKPMREISAKCGFDICVGPQVLRKTFTTLMGNLKNREMAKSITGHKTDEMHDHYTNIRPEDQYAAVVQLVGEVTG